MRRVVGPDSMLVVLERLSTRVGGRCQLLPNRPRLLAVVNVVTADNRCELSIEWRTVNSANGMDVRAITD